MGTVGTAKSVRCKLCAAFAASRLPTAAQRGLAGSETFTKNSDICDACLGQNYAAKRRGGSLKQWSALTFGQFTAIIATFFITISHGNQILHHLAFVPGFVRPLAMLAVVYILTAIPCILACWLLIHAMSWLRKWRIRVAIKEEQDDNAAIDGERFFWLANWALLTGHVKFRRRMLKRMAAVGYSTANRSHDET